MGALLMLKAYLLIIMKIVPASYYLSPLSAHSEFRTHSGYLFFHMTPVALVSFTEDTGNLAAAVTCEMDLTGLAISFSFEIPKVFKGRQGDFLGFWRPSEIRGFGKKPSLLPPRSSGTLRLTRAVVGTPRPLCRILLRCWRLFLHAREISHAGKIPSRRLPCIFCSCSVRRDVGTGMKAG